MSSWNKSYRNRDKNRKNNNNQNYNNNSTSDYVEITSDYKNPQPESKVDDNNKDNQKISKILKIDAPVYIPKNSSLNKNPSVTPKDDDLDLIIQQDKFFFNNKFNLNQNNQNMLINTLHSIPSQNIAALPQNPLVNPYLNGQKIFTPTSVSEIPLTFNLPTQVSQTPTSSSLKTKLDINAKSFVYKKKQSEDNKQVDLNKQINVKQNEQPQNFLIPRNDQENNNKESLIKEKFITKNEILNDSTKFSQIEHLSLNNKPFEHHDELFNKNTHDYNSNIDAESLNNIEERVSMKENEIVEKILEEYNPIDDQFNILPNIEDQIASKKEIFNDTAERKDIINKDSARNDLCTEDNKITEKKEIQNINETLTKDFTNKNINEFNTNSHEDIIKEIQVSNVIELNDKNVEKESVYKVIEALPQNSGHEEIKENISEKNSDEPEKEKIFKRDIDKQDEFSNKDHPEINPTNEFFTRKSIPFRFQIQQYSNTDATEINPFKNNGLLKESDTNNIENIKKTDEIENYDKCEARKNNSLFNTQQSILELDSISDLRSSIEPEREQERTNEFSKTVQPKKKLNLRLESDYINSELQAFIHSNRNSNISRISKIVGAGVAKDSKKKPANSYKELISPRIRVLNTCRPTIKPPPSLIALFDKNDQLFDKELNSKLDSIVNSAQPIIEEEKIKIDVDVDEKESDGRKINHGKNVSSISSINLEEKTIKKEELVNTDSISKLETNSIKIVQDTNFEEKKEIKQELLNINTPIIEEINHKNLTQITHLEEKQKPNRENDTTTLPSQEIFDDKNAENTKRQPLHKFTDEINTISLLNQEINNDKNSENTNTQQKYITNQEPDTTTLPIQETNENKIDENSNREQKLNQNEEVDTNILSTQEIIQNTKVENTNIEPIQEIKEKVLNTDDLPSLNTDDYNIMKCTELKEKQEIIGEVINTNILPIQENSKNNNVENNNIEDKQESKEELSNSKIQLIQDCETTNYPNSNLEVKQVFENDEPNKLIIPLDTNNNIITNTNSDNDFNKDKITESTKIDVLNKESNSKEISLNSTKQENITKEETINQNKTENNENEAFQKVSKDISTKENKKNIIESMESEQDISKFSTGVSVNLNEIKSSKEEIVKDDNQEKSLTNLKSEQDKKAENAQKISLGEILNKPKQNPSDSKYKYHGKKPKGKGLSLVTVNTQTKESQPKNQISQPVYEIMNKYFKVSKVKKNEFTKIVYNEDYILHFKNWKISNETTLIQTILSSHIDQMKIYSEEKINLNNPYNKQSKNKKDYSNHHQQNSQSDLELNRQQLSKSNTFSNNNENFSQKQEDSLTFSRMQSLSNTESNINTSTATIGNWARRNFAEAEKEAQEYKGKLDNERKVDPITDELKEILNKSTLDNYDSMKSLIFEKISTSIEYQEKFLEVLFKKAIVEKSYVVIYARLCKDLDNELPQKIELSENEKKSKNNKPYTIFRSKLIEKCRKIFKEEQTIFDSSKFYDIEEKEQKEKDFILGNVNFIGELIKSKILSKFVVFQCMDHLQKNKEKSINIEGIVMLLDKFGTEINNPENVNKMKPQELKELNDKLDIYFNTLKEIEESNKNVPGFIKYKIINLIEKRKRGWQESKVDQVLKIKTLKEVHDEYEQEMKENSTTASSSANNNNIQVEKKESINVNKLILNDLASWKNLKESKKNENTFNWKPIDNLIKKEKLSVASIIQNFGEIIIDFIKDLNDCEYCYTYLDGILSYYSLNKNAKLDVVDAILNHLKNLNDNLLDNKLLIEMWANILYSMINNEVFVWSDLEKINDLSQEQYTTIYDVSCKTVKKFTTKEQKQYFNEMSKLNFFKTYQSIFINFRNN